MLCAYGEVEMRKQGSGNKRHDNQLTKHATSGENQNEHGDEQYWRLTSLSSEKRKVWEKGEIL